MRRIKVSVGFGFHGCEHKHVFEFDDDMSDEQIEDEVYAWACEFIDLNWEEVESE